MTYLWLALALPVVWFVQNCVHESSHLLFGWLIEGRKPLEFKPWPHRFEGRFYFARCVMGEATKDGWVVYRHAAPPTVNSIYMCLMGLCILIHAVFGVFAFCALIDTLFWFYGYLWGSELSDGKRFRKAVGP